MNKQKCQGCESNFYNGNNEHGIKECWHFKDAKIIWRKRVSVDQTPPWNQKRERLPNCYNKKRYVFFNDNRKF